MPPIPWRVQVTNHPGSSLEEIENEPSWESGHQHRVGFLNRDNRRPGITHDVDEKDIDDEIAEEAKEDLAKLKEEVNNGELVNWRDIIHDQKDLHLRHPDNRSLGWRYVLNTTEDWVRNKEQWPANVEKKKKEEEAAKKKAEEDKSKKDGSKEQGGGQQDEEQWKRSNGEGIKHHDAYAEEAQDSGYSSDESKESEKNKTEYVKPKSMIFHGLDSRLNK